MNRSTGMIFGLLMAAVAFAPDPAVAAGQCDIERTRDWPAYRSCQTEARAKLDEATDMWRDSRPGWLDALNAAHDKRKECSALHDRASAEARTCRAKHREEAEEERRRKADERAKKHVEEETRTRALRELGRNHPEFLRIYRGANMAEGYRTLAGNRGDAGARLKGLTDSIGSMRGLFPSPPGGAWDLSGDLLRITLREYREIVTDKLAELDRMIARFKDEHDAYNRELEQRLRDQQESQRRWRRLTGGAPTPRSAPAAPSAPAQSTCPPGWAVDYYHGVACTCRGTSTMSIASAWANYREYGACR